MSKSNGVIYRRSPHPLTHSHAQHCAKPFQVGGDVPYERREGLLHQGVGGEGSNGGVLQLVHTEGLQAGGRVPQVNRSVKVAGWFCYPQDGGAGALDCYW